MAMTQFWRHIPGKVLLFLINVVSATALIFEGMKNSMQARLNQANSNII